MFIGAAPFIDEGSRVKVNSFTAFAGSTKPLSVNLNPVSALPSAVVAGLVFIVEPVTGTIAPSGVL